MGIISNKRKQLNEAFKEVSRDLCTRDSITHISLDTVDDITEEKEEENE